MTPKEIYQHAYDSLLSMADGAYENSKNTQFARAGLSDYWLGKSEAYENGAEMIMFAACANMEFISTRKSQRRIEIDQAIREELNSENLEFVENE